MPLTLSKLRKLPKTLLRWAIGRIVEHYFLLLDLIYPRHCAGCDIVLNFEDKVLCPACEMHFPVTDHHKWDNNPLEQRLKERMPIEAAAAFYKYIKGGKVQNAIHRLKYRGFPHIGEDLGRRFGRELVNGERFASCEVLIPVPLHKEKLKKRGYNQAEMIAEGMSQTMKIPVSTRNLLRVAFTETQTKKSRWDRYKNVETIFTVKRIKDLQGKHILLVDDVITTGSTLEACCKILKDKVPGIKISVAALATPP